MSIRKGVAYDRANDKYVGYVDLGGIHVSDSEELAGELLVFAIVSYIKKFKFPVTYFFVNNLNANVLAQLTHSVICELRAVGVTVRSIHYLLWTGHKFENNGTPWLCFTTR